MSRIVDIEPVITKIENGQKENRHVLSKRELVDAIADIMSLEPIDAVHVVRCRDCKHKRMVMKSGCLGCDIQCCLHPYDWYCPDGEKVTK